MGLLKSGGNAAIAVFIDGLEVKLAKLSVKKGNVVLDELQSATLATKLEERQMVGAEAAMETMTDSSDAFSLSAGPTETIEEEAGGGDNNSVILGLLSRYPPGKYNFGYAIAEPSLYYHVFENDFGLTGKKLRARLIEELGNVRSIQPSVDAVDHFMSVEKNLVCIIREDGVSLLHVLEEIKSLLGKRMPRIPVVDSADVALMNLARANFGFGPEESTAIVYVGVEFSRLIFLKGSEFLHFAPVLGEGFDSPNIQNTVYSRLLLEQDNIGVPRLDKVILAGHCKSIGFDEFMRDQLPGVDVQYLTTPYLDTSSLPADMQDSISEYAVPIATAWKILDQDHPAFYKTNLLPESVKESQRAFKLAWHGYVLLAMVFFSTLFFTSRFFQLQKATRDREQTLAQLQLRVTENQRMQAAINSLNAQIARYLDALAVYEQMAPGADRWGKAVDYLTRGVEDINSLWIDEVKSSPDGSVTVRGYSLYRSRIPQIAALFDGATLTRVELKTLREDAPPVYNFELTVPPVVDTTVKAPAPETPAAQ